MAWWAVVGGLLSALGNYREGQQAWKNAQSNADMLRQTAQMNADRARAEAGMNARMAEIQGQYDSSVAQMNAKIAGDNAARAREAANYHASRIRDRNRRLKGKQVAGYAKAGIQLEGTPTDVLYDSAIQGELDALSVEYVGRVEAVRLENQALLHRYQGTSLLTMSKFRSKMYLQSGNLLANSYMYEADLRANLLLQQGRNQRSASNWNTISSLLSVFSNYSGRNTLNPSGSGNQGAGAGSSYRNWSALSGNWY